MTKRAESKYKINRRLGVNLWGRPKSPISKRDYGPGQHGQRRKGKPTDFGIQLMAKQKLKGYYGNIGEKQFRKYYFEAVRRKGDTSENLIELLERRLDEMGRETLRVTDAGVQVLAATLQANRRARDAHEALVELVARDMQSAGRVVWRGLSLRAPLPADDGSTLWAVAMPDVYSIRHTTLEDCTEPVVHEIKVSRADLLSDLRNAAKGLAYLALGSQCWYVLKRGIATIDEVPTAYGVMFADGVGLEVARPAPRRAMRLPFAVWMTLARSRAEPDDSADAQGWLGAPDAA